MLLGRNVVSSRSVEHQGAMVLTAIRMKQRARAAVAAAAGPLELAVDLVLTRDLVLD